ncbi:MAG TPA: 1-(5-phosphoribosyl)-5-[(5-phosphoribosylamino)methylideneamino]imidazole-4-carboxamide isomerase [Ktedonosporobacter sp.]|jgi:phosphoribosylformimino-5-aminoimidazole carboxamide ribotide isomerase|nr:1-(5-phosphoribosyl)-5-[(5-phosphoribosylamino)methylideneamino]imidazole-4-carboxamide isomerase [Ktedonosporobacter sp.]
MIILPAIDIKDGRCVRLYQGDYARSTVYDSDPVQVALRWQTAGASWLHIVDLDGAAAGYPVNVALIKKIRAATTLHIELGGGMRSLEHIEHTLELGVDRVVLGTVAITDRALLQEAIRRWGERIAVGLDARDGWVAIAGWRETSRVMATTLAAELSAIGVQRFIYTDIARDGALVGPNLSALREMQGATPRPLIASGGVSSLADLRALAELGVEGAIVGKAIYTGDVDLAMAIKEIERA